MKKIRYLLTFIILCFLGYSKIFAQYNDCATADANPSLNLACNVSWNATGGTWTGTMSSCYTASSSETDSWQKITGDIGTGLVGNITLEYTSNEDAVIAIWTGSCGSLVLDDCKDTVTEKGTESIEFSIGDGETVYLQVIDKDGAGDMTGNICLYTGGKEDYDICNDAFSINLGDCDFDFDFETNHINNEGGLVNASTCTPPIMADAWLTFTATESGKAGFLYTNEDEDVAIEIYSGTCGTLTLVDKDNALGQTNNACANNVTGTGDEYVEFDMTSGTTYYIRVINTTAIEMTGTACLYKVYARNSCGDITALQTIDGGALDGNICNLNVNILSYYDNTTVMGGGAVECGGDFALPNTRDIWIRYKTSPSTTNLNIIYESDQDIVFNLYTACPPNTSNQFTVICQRNNPIVTNNISVSANTEYYIRLASQSVAQGKLCIFEGSNNIVNNPSNVSSIPDLVVGTTCEEVPATILNDWFVFNNPPTANFEISCEPSLVPDLSLNCLKDGWVKLDFAGWTGDVTLSYSNENNSGSLANDIVLEVYKAPDPLNADDFDGNTTNGEAQVTNLCINNTDEGIETMTFNAADLNASFPLGTNEAYYLRVAELNEDASNPPTGTTFGKICAFQKTLKEGDLCSDAKIIALGDCESTFKWSSGEFFNNPTALPSCVPTTFTEYEDGWLKFKASNISTTFELLENNKDVVLEFYTGAATSCGSLNPADIDDATSGVQNCSSIITAGNLGEVTFATIPETWYYIRIINVSENGASLTTSLNTQYCIYNTAYSNFCDDSGLLTLLPDACNITFKVKEDFDLSGPVFPTQATFDANPLALSANSTTPVPGNNLDDLNTLLVSPPTDFSYQDAFTRFIGSGGTMTIEYQNTDPNSNPMLMIYVYNGSAIQEIDCGNGFNGIGNGTNLEAWVNDHTSPSIQTETLEFPSVGGKVYILRIINLTATDDLNTPNEDMSGLLCIYGGSTGPQDCAVAKEIDIRYEQTGEDVGECNVQFNVSNNNSCNALPALSCSNTAPNFYINCGGPAVTDGGVSWESGDSYLTSSGNSGNPSVTVDVSGCSGFPYPEVFRTTHWVSGTPLQYEIPIASGNYDIDLLFRETHAPSQVCDARILDVTIETTQVLDDYQAWSDWQPSEGGTCPAGVNDACRVRSFSTTVSADGILNIQVTGVVGSPILAGIIITPSVAGTPVCESEAWFKFTTNEGADGPGGITGPGTPADNMTIQYDNTNNTFASAADVSIEVYREVTTGSNPCTTPANYTLVGCSDKLNAINGIVEGIEEINFSVDDAATANETYYVRVINKDATYTAFGKLCIFYGETIARPACIDALDYGNINGVWKNFTVDSEWDDFIMPEAEIPDCVEPDPLKGIGNPAINSQGWFKFHIKNDISEDAFAVTIQYDNKEFSSTAQNSINGAIAVYRAEGPTDLPVLPEPNSDINDCELFTNGGRLTFMNCSDNVTRGTESMTITVDKGYTYFVRVMNVFNEQDMPGRIRVFKHTDCSLGPEMVVDGDFAGWGEIVIPSGATATPTQWTGSFANSMDSWIMPNPDISNYVQHNFSTNNASLSINSKSLNKDNDLDHYARFAGEAGYAHDGHKTTSGYDNHSFRSLYRKIGVLWRGYRYGVGPQMLSRKDGINKKWSFYAYGAGYSGYGGFKFNKYCKAGSTEINSEACDGFGTPQANYPALIPTTADANFMGINGTRGGWKIKDGGIGDLHPSGKVWCQTIDVEAQNNHFNTPNADANPTSSSTTSRYFVISVWGQNIIPAGQNISLPSFRITICDMYDENTGTIVDAGVVTAGNHPLGPNRTSPLPGVTYTPGYDAGASSWNLAKNPDQLTVHYPQLYNGKKTIDGTNKTGVAGFYGAMMPCNIPASEGYNTRLKLLSSAQLLPESPDAWQQLTCIYRAPAEVTEFNVCVETPSQVVSPTPGAGNDWAIDNITVRQCTPSTTDYLDDLLKGDACELTDEPVTIGVPLDLSLLDFTGKDIGRKVALSWLMILDEKVDRFSIERSINGVDFENIGDMDATGEIDELNTFRFLDERLPQGINNLYYRLKIFDTANKMYISHVIIIRLSNLYDKNELKIIPNPSDKGETVAVEFEAYEGIANIKVVDIMSNQVLNTDFEIIEGKNQFFLSTSNLSSGMYIVQVTQGNERYVAKMIVR